MSRKLFEISCYSKKKERRRNEFIQEKIAIQNKKLAKISVGYVISETSSIGDEYKSTYRIENGVVMIEFVIKNNITMKMLEFMSKFGFYYSLKIINH